MSEQYKVIYSPQAADDLKDIYSYIAFELLVPDTAKNQVNRIRKQICSLDFMPARFPIVDWEPWQSMKMHKIPIDNFIVFYLIDSDHLCVTIIRIVYGGRDIEFIAQSDKI
ncbi:type II toxin-antitoxin system RelE/ParE family toxin [Emergencia sp. JLR.KK010]|uniref:type II toxin-antitoxin system RelE/ParE family toxin n=2 Tax=unclassified Emergencia TaxID=2642996 RepID=UPI0030CF116D